MGDGSRQGSPLDSHRSSRDSGDDLWTDQRLDHDPLRVAAEHVVSSATPKGASPAPQTPVVPSLSGGNSFTDISDL